MNLFDQEGRLETQIKFLLRWLTSLSICLFCPQLSNERKSPKFSPPEIRPITTTKQLIANSQQQKKALIQQLLTGKRRVKIEDKEVA